MDKDNCCQDYFNSLITRFRIYLKKLSVEDGNLIKVPRKKSCRNNVFLPCKKHFIEFQDK